MADTPLTFKLLPELPGEALHARTTRSLRHAIRQGLVPEGTRLPGHRSLAASLGISRNTVVDAIEQLEIEGFVEVRPRSGTRVNLPSTAVETPPIEQPEPVLPLSAWANRALTGITSDVKGTYTFDFRIGQPVPELYPAQAWASALARRAEKITDQPTPDSLGPLETRRALASYLRAELGAQLTPNMVMMTGGTQSALDALARLFLEEGRTAALEFPPYARVDQAFRATGATVQSVPVDEQGLMTEHLPQQASLAYVTPGCQYPTTVTMSAPRRQQLIKWARTRNCFIVEDNYAADFHHTGRPPSVLQGLAPDRVILLGSFSKSLAPVTRSGFVVAPPNIIRVLAYTRPLTDHIPSRLDTLALADLLSTGQYARHLRNIRQLIRHRKETLQEALQEHLPHWKITPTHAGFHTHIQLPSHLHQAEILQKAQTLGVALTPTAPHGMLLAFAHLPSEQIRVGIKLLASC